jgi:hypothetical protein
MYGACVANLQLCVNTVPRTCYKLERSGSAGRRRPKPTTVHSPHIRGNTVKVRMAELVSAAAVVEALRAGATRATALDSLEARPVPIPSDVALAAAPVLVDVVAVAEDRMEHDRAALLLARLLDEAGPEAAAVNGAAFQGERLAAWYGSRMVVESTQRALETGEAMTQEDARSYACLHSRIGLVCARGATVAEAAAGRPHSRGIFCHCELTSRCLSTLRGSVPTPSAPHAALLSGGRRGAWTRSCRPHSLQSRC